MEYKINEFNLTDNKYTDLKGLITCFESSIPLSNISICNFGPNLLHVRSSENKYLKTKEDKKILKEQVNLILSSLNSKEKNDENNFCFSMSNNINKIYLKRFLSQLNLNLHKNKNKDNVVEKQDVYELMNFFELISYFTCIKDEYGDEIPLTDYSLSVSIDKNIKYNKLNLIQFNYEYIFHNIINKSNDQNGMNLKNNIHFFYMLLYNLPINDIASYIYCEETKDFFSIFSEEETLDELAKRFFFINQFKILKNDDSYKLMTVDEKNNNVENIRYNFNAIKSEYEFYSKLYQNYLKNKKELAISDEEEKKIFGIYFAILLLSEFDYKHDNLFNDVINKNYRELKENENSKSLTSVFSLLRSILISDVRFSSLGSNKKGGEKKKISNLLNKLANCLGISEDKIFYILLTENTTNKEFSIKENIISNEFSFLKNIVYFMNILYLKSIFNILDSFSAFNKKQKLTVSSYKSKKTINILLMRSNLVYSITYENYLFYKNSYLTIGDNFVDSNSFIIKQNIKEHLYANYFQEKKNYIYLKNSLSLNFKNNFPKINENEEYLNSIFKENINFEEILNVYENDICGLLKLLNYGENNDNVHNYNIFDSKGGLNINHFKVQFNKNISRKNKIEIIDIFNSNEQKNETYIKVSHSFGVFLYDLNQLFGLDNKNKNIFNITPNIYKEQNIFKILEYQPNLNNYTSFKFFQEKTNNIINSLTISKKPIFISCLIELNKFNTLTLFDDMKINIIYVYYSNYYNYLLNINDIKQYFIQNNIDFIPKYIRNKDNLTFFKFITKKFRITLNDYIIDNYNEKKEKKELHSSTPKYRIKEPRGIQNKQVNYVYMKNKFSNSFGNDKNIALMMYKYNYSKFIQTFCDKISKSKFNYFIYAINGVKAFVKLTKIYKEKLVLSNIRNLMTDIIVDNYNIVKEEKDSITPINHQIIPKIDNLDELVFDFNKEALGKMLPKLRSNLVQLKRMWKDYLCDIIYLINNNSIFYNKECAQLIIEQRMINFQILLFLFHKNYKFINDESVRKFGVLLSQFIRTVSREVLRLFIELRQDFDLFLSENNGINNNLNELKSNFENITFEKLITKRIEIQNIINQKIKEKEKKFEKINQQKMREKNLENKNLDINGGEEIVTIGKNNKFVFEENIENEPSRNKYKEFSISKKDLYEGRLDNNLRSSKSRKPSSRIIESFNTVNRNSNNNILQLTQGNSSINDTPNTEINDNRNNDLNDKNSNMDNTKNRQYKYKYSNISLKKVEDINKPIKSNMNKREIKENNSYTEKSSPNNIDKNKINELINKDLHKELNSQKPLTKNNKININLNDGEILKKIDKNNLDDINNIKQNKENNKSKDENDKINKEIQIQNEIDNKNPIINNNDIKDNKISNPNSKVNNELEEDKKNFNENEVNKANEKTLGLKDQNNLNNLNNFELSNIDTQGNNNNESKKLRNNKRDENEVENQNQNKGNNDNLKIKESEKVYQSPSFSKENFGKEDNINGIENNNNYNEYTFKNTTNNSKNNFNKNSSSNNDNATPNEQNDLKNIDENKKSSANINKTKNKNSKKNSKKSSKKNSNASSHKRLNSSNEQTSSKISFGNNKNNYISFKDNNQDEVDENINDEEVIDINNYSLFSDEELQKIYQTLSDINEVNIENNNPSNYMTYPLAKTNDNLNIVIKEVPIKVKKRISTFYMKLEKEKEIRRISEQEQIHSLKELEKEINQIRKEINLIDINDYYNTRIEQLHFYDSNEDREMSNKLYKMADELNKDYYNDIDFKLKLAKEKINELNL